MSEVSTPDSIKLKLEMILKKNHIFRRPNILKVKDWLKQPIVDPKTGKINLKYNQPILKEDYYL